MHQITGDRDKVLKLMNDTIQELGKSGSKAKAAGIGSLQDGDDALDVLTRGYQAEQPKQRLSAAGISVPNERADDSWYAPRNRAVAVFQSVMDEYLEAKTGAKDSKEKAPTVRGLSIGEKQPKTVTLDDFYVPGGGPGPGKTTAQALMEKFDNLDPGWVEVVWEKTKSLLKGKHKFTAHTSTNDFRFQMNDTCTIAVVGDWGGGNDAAKAVANQILSLDPKPDHVIHLGDVYYAGTPKEVNDRFLNVWPSSKEAGKAFALNSNHEMYSGGYGYFDTTLPAFQQPASYFSLANNNWRFIGLDTGYIDHDLNPPQVDWLTAQFQGNNPKTILLSHHQLFSAYEQTDAKKLQSRVQPFIDAKQIYGWIWGHEHLCVVYQENMGIKAACLGNGCFPYNPPGIQPQVPVEWMNNRAQPNDPDYKGIHTFALLKVTPAQIDIQYIDQDGFVGHTQTWS